MTKTKSKLDVDVTIFLALRDARQTPRVRLGTTQFPPPSSLPYYKPPELHQLVMILCIGQHYHRHVIIPTSEARSLAVCVHYSVAVDSSRPQPSHAATCTRRLQPPDGAEQQIIHFKIYYLMGKYCL